MPANIEVLRRCRCCGSENLQDVVDFGQTAIADDYFKQGDNTEQYPLVAALCQDCGLLQLRHVIEASAIYDNYIYATSSSPGLKAHFAAYAQRVHEVLSLTTEHKILDIGCNDGVLLSAFEALGCKVCGVEPSEHTTEMLRAKGVNVYVGYWDAPLAKQLLAEQGQMDVITANNMFANIDDIDSFVTCLTPVLAPSGSFIIETVSHLELMRNFVFDNIYHEHLTYFSVTALDRFFARFGMEVYRVEAIDTKGGSMRVYAGFAGQHQKQDNVSSYVRQEQEFGLFSTKVYAQYTDRVHQLRQDVEAYLAPLIAQGRKIVGFGASATCTTVMYMLGLSKYLSYLVDDNPVKQDTFSPGFRIPVKATSMLYEDNPDYVVIMPWRFGDMFISNNQQFLAQGGTFVHIIPDLKEVGQATQPEVLSS